MTDSIYDQLNAYGTVAKQRFVENFSGSALDTDRWQTFAVLGTLFTVSMSDSVDDGLKFVSPASSSRTYLTFGLNPNEKRQYAHNGSVCITVTKADTSSGEELVSAGLHSNTNVDWWNVATGSDYINYYSAGTTKYRLRTANGSATEEASSTVVPDSSWHTHKLETLASSCEYSIDGLTAISTSTSIPDTPLQPMVTMGEGGTTARTLRIRYMECYNT